ncbi:short chain oxidoreductase [Diplodia corticola]|uniref:Short chain oxidoreductase n=1 Tax=Diplodia corticola TaxID=236234 RepID=A0A1J9QLT8_9PEZI|nr:short chain oxidoreductase [Diplodia corticola]OJD29425.1 short chain oxidoreductase [Diplodia corticola]
MASYFVTGSSRGLGLAIAGLLASKPVADVGKVFASARSETTSLKELVAKSSGRVEFVQLDITSQESATEAASHVTQSLDGKGLDVLINNAGVMNYTADGITAMSDLDETFKINVTGVHYVTTAFLPLLEKGQLKKIINISTTLGSIGLSKTYAQMPVPSYKISKAALNMLTVQYALSLADKGFTVVAISPGWIQTDLGGTGADLTIEQGSNATADIIFRVKKEDNGKFLNVHVPGWEKAEGINQYDGGCPPW